MTKQKQLVLALAQSHHDHPTADRIYCDVLAIDRHISRATVYRNLEQLSDTGSLLRVKVPGPDRYDSRLEYHYHMLCKGCGKVFDIPLEYQYHIDDEVKRMTGLSVDRHRMIFEGLCAGCQSEGSDSAAE